MLTQALFLAALLQEPATTDGGVAPAGDERSSSAEELRERIHGMRMNLLFGGDRVRAAESEAIDFYQSKVSSIEERVDGIHVELSERRASYDVALERTLSARSADARRDAMHEASGLRAELTGLELEAAQLEQRRGRLYEMVAAVEERDRERERLAAQLEANAPLDGGIDMPFSGIGLAPAVAPAETSPLDDEAFVEDLLRRDPRGARAILFEADPAGYWRRFPLRVPARALARAIPFPTPDLPGLR